MYISEKDDAEKWQLQIVSWKKLCKAVGRDADWEQGSTPEAETVGSRCHL